MSEPLNSNETTDQENNEISYFYSISLRILHPHIDPKKITESLGIHPKGSGKVGEPRMTPKGNPLNGVNKQTYWYSVADGGQWPKKTLNVAIKEILAKLLNHQTFFRQIREEHGRIELCIGWFFNDQNGDRLTYDVLALAGDLQIDLDFDVYPATEPPYLPTELAVTHD